METIEEALKSANLVVISILPGTQKFLCYMVQEMLSVENVTREEIKVNPIGVNHFTWLTWVMYHDVDLIPYYREFCKKYVDGYISGDKAIDDNWMNNVFESREKVKIDLFNRFGIVAAAGDRHLAEFCPGKWYLESPERVKEMYFGLTSVAWRKDDLKNTRLVKSAKLVSGEEPVEIKCTGEEGVNQIRSLLGLIDLVPEAIYPLISRICAEQELVAEGIFARDLNKIFCAFSNDPLVTCGLEDAKNLFKEMCENTKEYLTMYDCTSIRPSTYLRRSLQSFVTAPFLLIYKINFLLQHFNSSCLYYCNFSLVY